MKLSHWTRSFWMTLVYLAGAPRIIEAPQRFVPIWDGLGTVLPCAKCRHNFRAKNLRADDPQCQTPAGLMALVLALRNAIASSQGARLITPTEQQAFRDQTRAEAGKAFSSVLSSVAREWDTRMGQRAPSVKEAEALRHFVTHLVACWPDVDDAKRRRMVAAVEDAFWHTRYFGQVLDKDYTGASGQTRVMQVFPALQRFQRRFDLPPFPEAHTEEDLCTVDECGADLDARADAESRRSAAPPCTSRHLAPSKLVGAAILYASLLLVLAAMLTAVVCWDAFGHGSRDRGATHASSWKSGPLVSAAAVGLGVGVAAAAVTGRHGWR